MSSIVLLHCSDLHFGTVVTNERFINLPILRYYNAHSFTLARGMSAVLTDVAARMHLASEDLLYLVMSGDLTVKGHEREFAIGREYLRSPQSLWGRENAQAAPFAAPQGTISGDRLAAVPGNHDQWHGSRLGTLYGHNPHLRDTVFEGTPWRRVWTAGDLILEVYGLDSTAGLRLRSGDYRLRQQGKLSPDEIRALEVRLQQAEPVPDGKLRVRALIVHHTLERGGYYGSEERNLRRLAETYKISVILTGHTHTFRRRRMRTLPNEFREVWELRSPSALQGPDNRTHPSPGFLVHQLTIRDGRIFWQAWCYVWDQESQFLLTSWDDWDPSKKDFVAVPVRTTAEPRPMAEFLIDP